jgi:excisionase family DNA binding protein
VRPRTCFVTASDPGVTVAQLGLVYRHPMRIGKLGPFLTLAEVSRQTGLEPSWLRRLCQRGELPATKTGRDWLVKQEDLAAFQRRQSGRKRQ